MTESEPAADLNSLTTSANNPSKPLLQMRPAQLAVNGRFLLQNVTGVQKVAHEFLVAVDQLLQEQDASTLRVKLLAPAQGQFTVPTDFQKIELVRAGRLTGHAWEQVELPYLSRGWPLLNLGNLAPLATLCGSRTATYTMVHDLSYRYFPSAYSRQFRAAYRLLIPFILARSDHVFTVSHSERQAILSSHPRIVTPTKLSAVQNGGGEAALLQTAPPNLTRRDHAGLYVGSLSKRKNAEAVIEVASRLARSHGLTFRIIGSQPAGFEEAHLLPADDVRDQIQFLGQINDPDIIAAEYRRAKLFLFPSHYEASPLPPIEAMSHGCPVVASAIPSNIERCKGAALYAPPMDPHALYTSCASLLDDEAAWSARQQLGLEQASQFTWKRQALNILEELGLRAC